MRFVERRADLVRRCSHLRRTDRLNSGMTACYHCIRGQLRRRVQPLPSSNIDGGMSSADTWRPQVSTPSLGSPKYIRQINQQAGTARASRLQPVFVLDLCPYQLPCRMQSPYRRPWKNLGRSLRTSMKDARGCRWRLFEDARSCPPIPEKPFQTAILFSSSVLSRVVPAESC